MRTQKKKNETGKHKSDGSSHTLPPIQGNGLSHFQNKIAAKPLNKSLMLR
jgi:hypothetical protein